MLAKLMEVLIMNENTNISTNEEKGVATEAANEEAKTYTQEEVLALLQSETDKRVTAALKTQQVVKKT